MQLRKMMLMLTALGAMSGLMAGCGDDDNGAKGCTSNDECAGTEICHPTANVCVTTCSTGSDCPDTAKTCASIDGSATGTKICQCSTDALCNTGSETADFVCSDLDTVCVPKCTANSDCGTDRVCDTASGQCKEDDSAGSTCNGEAQSSCQYGQFCGNGTCTEVPKPTCINFDPARGGKQPIWTISSTGPVIYDVTKVSWGADNVTPAFCTGDTLKVRVKAYQPAGSSATFPPQKSGLNGLFYVNVDGDDSNGAGLIRPSEYAVTQNGKVATFTMNFCPQNINSISIGLFFTNGNEICSQISK